MSSPELSEIHWADYFNNQLIIIDHKVSSGEICVELLTWAKLSGCVVQW